MLSDLRFAMRQLLKRPGFTAVVVLTLALGIGVNTTVFSWVRGVLLFPLRGVSRPTQLVTLETLTPEGGYIDSSYPDYRDYRDQATTLAGVIAFQDRPLSLGKDDQPERIWAQFVSGNYFEVLGIKPVIGRFFTSEEQSDTPGKHPVAVLGARFWQRRYHADPAIVGQTIRVNRQLLTVVGIAPAEFAGTMVGFSFDAWVPLAMQPVLSRGGNWHENRKNRPLHLMGRLKSRVSLDQARSEVQTIAQRLARSYPDSNEGIGMTVLPIHRAPYGAQSRLGTLLKILLGAGGLVLLIASANVAHLLLARATMRQKELGIRLALGASRGRTIRQLLTESLLLAFLGGLMGIVMASNLTGYFGVFVPATHLPVMFDFALDGWALAFTFAVSVAAALVFGLAPALHAVGANARAPLREYSRGSTESGRSHRLRGMLAASEIALALITLIAAGLFLNSFQHAKHIDPGFNPANVLLASLNLSEQDYTRDQGIFFLRRTRERIEALPGVRAVSFAEDVPLGFDGGSWEDLDVPGYSPQRGESMKVYRNPVAPRYFELMRIPLIMGREFAETDQPQSLPVVIVNETFVRRFLSDASPLGRTLHARGRDWTIIGVVKDIKYQRLTESPRPYFYVPIEQVFEPDLGLGLHIRTQGPPESLLQAVQRELRVIDPSVSVFEALPLSDYISAAWFPQKVAAVLLSVLSALALVLAALGLFSVMAYTVSQRTQEIGIRMALGARIIDVMCLVVAQGLRLALSGIGIGLAGSFALTPLMASQLAGVSPTDPLTFITVVLLLVLVALMACWLPAYRASKVDPMASLRCE